MIKRKCSLILITATSIFALIPRSLFALMLVHEWHPLTPKGSKTGINVVANGARYRFYVDIQETKTEDGFVYAGDGYKYLQRDKYINGKLYEGIKWEVEITGTTEVGDIVTEDEVSGSGMAEKGNNNLRSLRWQTPVLHKSYTVRVTGNRWPYRGKGGPGPYDPSWGSSMSGELVAPTIYDTAIKKVVGTKEEKITEGEETWANPGDKLEVEAKASDGKKDIENAQVTIYWVLEDPSPTNTGTGKLSERDKPVEFTKTGEGTGIANVDLTCSSERGDDHIVIAQDIPGASPKSSCKSGKVTVWGIQITEPNNDPVTDNNYAFDSSKKGKCSVGPCTAKVIPESLHEKYAKDIAWSLTPIENSDLKPKKPKGDEITFTYTDLPISNSQFGDKNLQASLTLDESTVTDTQIAQIFFTKTATNNPGGKEPNWYYYWSQTSASSGTHKYNPNLGTDGAYTLGENYFYIGPSASGQDGGYYVDGEGIDNFGSTCLHEGKHMDYFLTAWGSYSNYLAKKPTEDKDGDYLKDADEPALGYDPTKKGTPDNKYCSSDDFEDLACCAEATWKISSADSEDWADPGHQSNK